jgi:hypothetical protein
VEAVNATNRYVARAYGPSGTAPDDVREFELYFERLEDANPEAVKRPDLLIFRKEDEQEVDQIVERLGGTQQLPFRLEHTSDLRQLLSLAVVAVECENSLWRATQMPDFDKPLRPQRRLDGKLGLAKGAVLPTVIVKEEDRRRLKDWQEQTSIPIHIWHVFYEIAFGLSLDDAENLLGRYAS